LLDVKRPNLFGGKGLLVSLSNHIIISGNEIYNFPGGGLRVTQSDYVEVYDNSIHHTTSRASVGTHGMVVEGLEPNSGNNSSTQKVTLARNLVYSNYNEIYSWVQTKTIVTTQIDEGKGISLLRTGAINGFNGIIRVENNIAYDNGKSGIHTNDVDKAEIINNTVYDNAHSNIYDPAISGGNNAVISIQQSDDIKIINNIVVVDDNLAPGLKALSEGQGCTGEIVTNNIIFGGAASDFVGGYIVANPQFINQPGHNVQLLSTSPAINTGSTSVFAITDYLNVTRDAMPDIGAYEYIAPLSIEVLHFDGYATDEGNLLTWLTIIDSECNRFEVERSPNAWNWETIATLPCDKNTSSDNNNTLLDKNPIGGKNYYRLKVINR
jgi:parallel beta-helix repeat protein